MKTKFVIIALLVILSFAGDEAKAQGVRFNVSVGNDPYYYQPGYYVPAYRPYYPPRYYAPRYYAPRPYYRYNNVRRYDGYRQGRSHGYYKKNYAPRPHRGHGHGHWKGRGKGHYKHRR